MSSRRQRNIPLGGRYRQVSLYLTSNIFIYYMSYNTDFAPRLWFTWNRDVWIGNQKQRSSTINLLVVFPKTIRSSLWNIKVNALNETMEREIIYKFDRQIPVISSHTHDGVIKMETFAALLDLYEGNPPVPEEFPSQRTVTWSFDAFFDLCLNKRLTVMKMC